MIFLLVRLNGSNPYSLVLDTGSMRMLGDRNLAVELGPKALVLRLVTVRETEVGVGGCFALLP